MSTLLKCDELLMIINIITKNLESMLYKLINSCIYSIFWHEKSRNSVKSHVKKFTFTLLILQECWQVKLYKFDLFFCKKINWCLKTVLYIHVIIYFVAIITLSKEIVSFRLWLFLVFPFSIIIFRSDKIFYKVKRLLADKNS